eukprot:284547_1
MGNKAAKDTPSLLLFGNHENGLLEFKYSAVKHCKKMCAYTWKDVTKVYIGIPPQYGCYSETVGFKNIFNKKCKYFDIHTKSFNALKGCAVLKQRHLFYRLYNSASIDIRCIIFMVHSKDKQYLIDNLSGSGQIRRILTKTKNEPKPFEDIKLEYNNYCEYHNNGFSGICYKYDLWNILRDKHFPSTIPLMILCNNGKLMERNKNDNAAESLGHFDTDEISNILLLSTKPSIQKLKETLINVQGLWNGNDDILKLIMEFVPGWYKDNMPDELKNRKIQIMEANVDNWKGMMDVFQWIMDNMSDRVCQQSESGLKVDLSLPTPLGN